MECLNEILGEDEDEDFDKAILQSLQEAEKDPEYMAMQAALKLSEEDAARSMCGVCNRSPCDCFESTVSYILHTFGVNNFEGKY